MKEKKSTSLFAGRENERKSEMGGTRWGPLNDSPHDVSMMSVYPDC